MANDESGPAWKRLEDQLGWYERKSQHHKLWYQWLKVAQITIAAGIPVSAAAGASAAVSQEFGAWAEAQRDPGEGGAGADATSDD